MKRTALIKDNSICIGAKMNKRDIVDNALVYRSIHHQNELQKHIVNAVLVVPSEEGGVCWDCELFSVSDSSKGGCQNFFGCKDSADPGAIFVYAKYKK